MESRVLWVRCRHRFSLDSTIDPPNGHYLLRQLATLAAIHQPPLLVCPVLSLGDRLEEAARKQELSWSAATFFSHTHTSIP
jgi:hypothetical protein